MWAAGQYAREEQELMLLLEAEHLKNVDIDDLCGDISFAFEDASARPADAGDLKTVVNAFKKAFFARA